MPNGMVVECHLKTGQPNHLNTGQMGAILFSYVLVQYLNGQSCTQEIDQPFEISTLKRLVFKCCRYSNGRYSDPHCISQKVSFCLHCETFYLFMLFFNDFGDQFLHRQLVI